MDLEQLKADWQELSKRVEKYEIINKQNTMNILHKKNVSTKGKMERFEIILFVICISYTAFLSVALHLNTQRLIVNESIIVCIAIFVLAGAWQLYKIILLKKMQLDSNTVVDLYKKTLRYKTVTMARLVVGMILLIPTMFLLFYFQRNMMPQELLIIALVGGLLGVAIGLKAFFTQWNNINQLLTDLNEINKLSKND